MFQEYSSNASANKLVAADLDRAAVPGTHDLTLVDMPGLAVVERVTAAVLDVAVGAYDDLNRRVNLAASVCDDCVLTKRENAAALFGLLHYKFNNGGTCAPLYRDSRNVLTNASTLDTKCE